MAAGGTGPHVRVLLVPAAAPAAPPVTPVDPVVEQAFFRNVLGSDVPRLPGSAALPDGARVQVWTYFVNDVVAAKRRFREAGIPVTFDPVAITTAYLGDHRVMGIQAPDGTVIELVQNAAHERAQRSCRTLPGFMMPLGSSAFLRVRISSSSTGGA